MQEKGRTEVFLDYHLRVGQVTRDTGLPAGHALAEQRLDETEIGDGTTVTLIDAKRPADWVKNARPRGGRRSGSASSPTPRALSLGTSSTPC